MSNILVVEDDFLTQSTLKDLLEAENYQVTVAQDGENAWQTIAENNFDLIICDLLLPKINGYELFSLIKNNSHTANIPFIVLTGQNKRQDLALGLEVGVNDYITKPFLNEELIQSIKTQLSKKEYLENCYLTKVNYTKLAQEENSRIALFKQNKIDLDQVDSLCSQSSSQKQYEYTVSNYVIERIKLNSSKRNQSTLIAACCLSLSIPDNFGWNWEPATTYSLIQNALQRLHKCLGTRSRIMQLPEGYFALIFPYINHCSQALNLVKIAQLALSQPFLLPGQILKSRPCIGMSYSIHRDLKIELLLDRAKQVLEQAQQDSENYYEIYSSNSASRFNYQSLTLIDDLRQAIQNQELEIYYQPQIDLLTGEVAVAEASIIWHHPQRGIVAPATILSLAQDTELIPSLEAWFLNNACQQLKYWHQLGFRQLQLALDITTDQFSRENLNVIVAEIIAQNQIAPKSLIWELEESLLFDNAKNVMDKMCRWKSWGINLAWDSFGSGYSLLSYLQQFPVTILKVDINYLGNILGQKDSRIALKCIFQMAHRAKIKVVVLNVSTPEQLHFLRQNHVELAQGNFFSGCLPPQKFEQLLQSKTNN